MPSIAAAEAGRFSRTRERMSLVSTAANQRLSASGAVSPPADATLVGLQGLADVIDVIATELLAIGVGDHEGDHRLAHHPGGRDGRGVGPFAERLGRLMGLDV